jgi:hypothetical protein
VNATDRFEYDWINDWDVGFGLFRSPHGIKIVPQPRIDWPVGKMESLTSSSLTRSGRWLSRSKAGSTIEKLVGAELIM